MKIRKLYRFESAHIVRNCSSKRCSQNQHGHSGIVEIFLETDKLDNGQMVYDFGLMKNSIGKFLDMFDHCYHYWNQESQEFIDYIHKFNRRWIELPFSPTAENYAIYFLKAINYLLGNIKKSNGEGNIVCTGVRYHETATGYAESQLSDLSWHNYYKLSDIKFSPELLEESQLTFKD